MRTCEKDVAHDKRVVLAHGFACCLDRIAAPAIQIVQRLIVMLKGRVSAPVIMSTDRTLIA